MADRSIQPEPKRKRERGAFAAKEAPYDFECLIREEGGQAKLLKCSGFGEAVVKHLV